MALKSIARRSVSDEVYDQLMPRHRYKGVGTGVKDPIGK